MSGRPRTFDEAKVLEMAMDLFWKNGYGATGLSELTDHMGIGRQSLYSTFGDKKQLFMRALTAYLELGMKEVRAEFERQGTPLELLKAWLDLKVAGMCTPQDGSRGCFALNSVVELCPDHEDVVELVQRSFEGVVELIAGTIQAGQERGEIRTDKTCADLAQFLMTGSGGLIVTAKLNLPPEVGERTADFLLECIRSKPAGA